MAMVAGSLLVTGCRTGAGSGETGTAPVDLGPADVGTWWKPPPGTSWQWQLTGDIDLSPPARVFDLDLFQTTPEQVAQLHARDVRVLCYVSVGSWEDWRPDRDRFPAEVIGRAYDGWPGERWLDIRQIDKLAAVMGERLDLCRAKGFDGVEPDNVDAFAETTGFPISERDQLRYNRWLAREAHRRGLAIALKNDPDQAALLQPYFDLAIVESCFGQEDWCDVMSVFIRAGKPVLMAEYLEQKVDWTAACRRATALGFSPILKRSDLDGWVQGCGP
jgi:endo-alpha-1,4-polygalactosaminidase (GH114 family)